MPGFFESIFKTASPQSTVSDTPHRYEGFRSDGSVVMSDRRGTVRGEVPNTKSGGTLSADPLAIYKPSGAKTVDAAKAMGNFTNWTYAAVNAIASEMSNIQWRLYQIDGKQHTEQEDHPLLELLEGVNDHMTGIELKYVTSAHLELTGNAYWLLEGVKNDTDKPAAIHPLNPGRVRVKLNKTTFPYKIDHYEFTIDGKVFNYNPYEILHLKYPDPNDPFVGIGVPQTIPTWIDSDNYAMEYNRKFFINGAALGLYIATQTNVEGQIDRIRQGFKEKYVGVENAHTVPVLPKGVDLKNAGASNKDMDFANLSDNTRDRILAGYRVSKTILGTAESDTNRSTAETADYVFSKRTIKPKMLLIVSYLNEYLVPRYGDNIYLTFIDPVPEDSAARSTEMQAAVGSAPVITANEARKNFLGLGPISGGDKLLIPTAMEIAGTTDTPEGEDMAPSLARTAEGWHSKSMRIRKGGKTSFSASFKMRKSLVEAFKEALDTKAAEAPAVKSVVEMTKAEYMEHYKRFDARTDHARKQLHNIFLGINSRQHETVLENLPKATGMEKSLADLFDPAEWIALTIDLATPILKALTEDEAAAALAMIGAEHRNILEIDSVRDALDVSIAKMAKSYNQTTLDQLKQTLGDKLTQAGGTSLTELTASVDDVYAFADSRRAGLIAKTEAYRVGNQANLAAWKESGVVNTVVWYTAEDSSVCPICAGLEGTEIQTGDSFFDDDYSDGDTPPAHPDCRCYIRPEDISLD